MKKQIGWSNTDRVLWLDYAKLIGIYFIILGHISVEYTQLIIWVYSFHIPLFFIISGFTDKGTDIPLKQLVFKSVRRLLLPYFFLYIISYAWWFVTTYLPNPDIYERSLHEAFVKPMLGMLIAEGRQMPFLKMNNIPLWFLVGLFFCRIIFRIGLSLSKNENRALLMLNVFAFLFVYIFSTRGFNFYFSLDSAIMAIPFYSLGYCLRNKIRGWNVNEYLALLSGIVFLFCNWYISLSNGRADVNGFNYGSNIFLFYFNGIVGSFGVIFLAMLFKNRRNSFALFLGTNTLLILAFHIPLIRLVAKLYGKIAVIAPDYLYSIPEALIVAFLVLLLCSVPIYIIVYYFPFVIGKRCS